MRHTANRFLCTLIAMLALVFLLPAMALAEDAETQVYTAPDGLEAGKYFFNMEDGGDLTPEQLTELMASTEAGRAMLDLVGQAEAAKAEAEAAQALTIRQQGVNQISKIDPTVKSFEDLSQAPEYDTFRAYVLENGLSWADAWRLAAADRLSRQAAQASRQRALNDISGKAHLSADAPKGGNGIDIPPSVEAAYRMMDPGISHDQALKKYAAYLKRTASTG